MMKVVKVVGKAYIENVSISSVVNVVAVNSSRRRFLLATRGEDIMLVPSNITVCSASLEGHR